MEIKLTPDDKSKIIKSILNKYAKVSEAPDGLFKYPTGKSGLEGQNYDSDIIKSLPESVIDSYCGVGNPFSIGPIIKGDVVLDIGCGGGVDTMVAALLVGSEGKAVGIDMTPDMVERATKNLQEASIENVTFQQGSAEDLPFLDDSFDVVISNGVFNLIADKKRALEEVFRVLKSGKHLMIADQVLTSDPPKNTKSMVESWYR